MSIFKIRIKPGAPAVFNPNPQTVFVNDSVFWFNGDAKNSHWPAPSISDPKGFLKFQITPNTSSTQVSFGEPQTISYICLNHPGETGQIIVQAPPAKAPAPNAPPEKALPEKAA